LNTNSNKAQATGEAKVNRKKEPLTLDGLNKKQK